MQAYKQFIAVEDSAFNLLNQFKILLYRIILKTYYIIIT